MLATVNRCLECAVRDASLCAAMDSEELSRLSRIGRRRHFEGGEVIGWSGEANHFCANVVAGVLKLTVSTEDGREQIVGLLFPGDFLGELFEDEAHFTASAVGPAELCTFGRADFARTLAESPRMARMLLRRTMASLQDARERMLTLARLNAGERIAGFLVEIVERTVGPQSGEVDIDLPLARGEMAGYLGLTIETVSRQMTRLRQAGIVAVAKGDRRCTIRSVDRLRALASA